MTLELKIYSTGKLKIAVIYLSLDSRRVAALAPSGRWGSESISTCLFDLNNTSKARTVSLISYLESSFDILGKLYLIYQFISILEYFYHSRYITLDSAIENHAEKLINFVFWILVNVPDLRYQNKWRECTKICNNAASEIWREGKGLTSLRW